MFTYMSTTFCMDEDEARVVYLSLRSIPYTDVKQIGATVILMYHPETGTTKQEEQETIRKIGDILNAITE